MTLNIVKFKNIKLLVLIFVIYLISHSFLQAQGWGGKRVASVNVEKVIEQTTSTTKEIRARIVSSAVSSLTPIITGKYKIEKLSIGDNVVKGQVIARLDNSGLIHRIEIQKNHIENNRLILNDAVAQIEGEQEILNINKEQLEILNLKVKRYSELLKTDAVSEQDYENIVSNRLTVMQQLKLREKTIKNLTFKEQQARNNLKRLNLEIKKLREDLKDYEIISPESGQIVFILLNKEGYIRSGDKIAEIQNLDDFEIEAEIPLGFLKNIISSKDILGEDFLGNKVTSTYRATLPFENPRTGTRTVRLKIKDSVYENLTANNAAIFLKIPTSDPKPVLIIPKDAVIPIGNGQVAYVFKEDSVIRKSLKLGGSYEDKIIVLDGLEKSDLVVTRGNELLKDGDKVKIAGKSRGAETKKVKIQGEKWILEWQGRQGKQSGTLLIGKDKSYFNDQEIKVTRKDNNVSFVTSLTLPFATLELLFEGKISDNILNGNLTISGLPNGQTRENTFSGKRVGS